MYLQCSITSRVMESYLITLHSIEQFIRKNKGDVTVLRKSVYRSSESNVPVPHEDVVHETSPMGTYHDVCVCFDRITVFVQCTYDGAIDDKDGDKRVVLCSGDSFDMLYGTRAGKDKDLNRSIVQ